MRVFCDLHIHSCLSPCGDRDMTPNNIVNMAKIKGLACIALTDHNSCANCRSAAKAAERAGIGFIPGMEINTREDIHAVCLFPDCDSAESFSSYVYSRIPSIKNRPDIFGEQLCLDSEDEVLYEEEKLLITACDISINKLEGLVAQYGGICFPAHINKSANGLIPILGAVPQECEFPYVELTAGYLPKSVPAVEAALTGRRALVNSDAHYLWDISEAQHSIELLDDKLGQLIRTAVENAENQGVDIQ